MDIIGTWNVTTMHRKEFEIIEEIDKYNLKKFGVAREDIYRWTRCNVLLWSGTRRKIMFKNNNDRKAGSKINHN